MKKTILIELPFLILALLFNALSSFFEIESVWVFILTSVMPLITFIYSVFSGICSANRKEKIKELELLNRIYHQIQNDSAENFSKNQARIKRGIVFHGCLNVDRPIEYFEKTLFNSFDVQIKQTILKISGKHKGRAVYENIKYNLGELKRYLEIQVCKLKLSEEEKRVYDLKI